MLNIPFIESRMRRLGLTQTQLAVNCEVSREAVSGWLAGRYGPRPSLLQRMADALQATVDEVLLPVELPASPVIAYRTVKNQEVSADAMKSAHSVAKHLRQLLPYMAKGPRFEPPTLRVPSSDYAFVQRCVRRLRHSIKLNEKQPVTIEDLVLLHENFGSFIVPVLWGGDMHGHENALNVYLPDSKTSWVLLNLNCKTDDARFWLAHELGHCYSLPTLQGNDGEKFAERFAAALLFPEAVAREILAEVRASDAPMRIVETVAKERRISVITVVRELDRAASASGDEPTGLDTPKFYEGWNAQRCEFASLAQDLFGNDEPSALQYVEVAEKFFRTDVFSALRGLQAAEGKASASFVAGALNMNVIDAIDLARALASRDAV
ncbi:ImmA/IrrE family metallo-endopeptidase [Paraburkholderia sp. GAS448]|uniref:ImmA/IrrE family metallo-endopeptidase n=1 Tax=Paraburkholderia sp. GAS448 TaxID=3035136 RepID=UPI003D22FB0D